ncbi:hypothetical protein niasHT_036777 [Heterodera trifolii]|uniref:RRM domain-containing protein n=1 Tax=Heterodera trifolii TaxID=157864 RepID=A0ABD2IV01_9BILA
MSHYISAENEPKAVEASQPTNRVFINNLTSDLEEFTIYKYCTAYGEITKCQILKDSKNGMSRGFGFITYALPSSAQAILNGRPHYIGHHKIDVRPAFPTSEIVVSTMVSSSSSSYCDQSDDLPKILQSRRLLIVYNIAEATRNDLSEPAIFGYLSSFGIVKEIVQQFSTSSEEAKQNPVNEYWIVDFLDELSVERCIARGALQFLQGVRIYAKKIISRQEIIRQKRQIQQQKEEATRAAAQQQQMGFIPPTAYFFGQQFSPVNAIPQNVSMPFSVRSSSSTTNTSLLFSPPPPPPAQFSPPLAAENHLPSSKRTHSNAEELLKGYGYQRQTEVGQNVPTKRYKYLQF